MLARRVGKRLDPPMVLEPGAVERNARDACGLRLLGDGFADRRRSLDVARALQAGTNVLLQRRSRSQHSRARVENLRIDVPRRTMDREAQRLQLPDLRAGARSTSQPLGVLVHKLVTRDS